MKKLVNLFLISQCMFILPSYAEVTKDTTISATETANLDKLIKTYQGIITKEPNDITYYIKLGDIYLDNYKNQEKALEIYNQGLKMQPKITFNQIKEKRFLDYMYEQSGNNDQVYQQKINIVMQHLKTMSELYFKMSAIYSNLNNKKEAENSLQKAIELNPLDWRLYNNLGIIYEAQKNYDLAIKIYNQALEHTKEYSYLVKINLATTYREMKRIDKSIETYQSIIDSNSEFSAAYYNLAAAYINENNNKAAINVLKKLLNKADENRNAILIIVATYLKDKNYNELLDFINQNVNKDTQSGLYYKLLGELYNAKGDIKLSEDNFALSCKNGETSSCNK